MRRLNRADQQISLDGETDRQTVVLSCQTVVYSTLATVLISREAARSAHGVSGATVRTMDASKITCVKKRCKKSPDL